MKRKVIGIGVVAVLAAAILFGTVGSVMEVVAATAAARNPDGGEYAARLTGGPEDGAALAALKYVCPFH